MKRYDLHLCDGGYECNAEMMESSIGDWVDAVEAINEIAKLKQRLSRYEGAVEVEGIIEYYPGTKIAGVFVHQKMPDEQVGQNVKILMFRETDDVKEEG